MYKVVYVLTSRKTDHYYNQMLVSILSVKKHLKDIPIVVLTDEETFGTLNGERREVFDYAKIVKVKTPHQFSNIEKSRFIKTSARHYIKGDYLFLDTDTLVCQDITSFIDFSTDLSFVADTHLPLLGRETIDLEKMKRTLDYLDYNIPLTKKYYNSGVYWAKDTEKVYNFFSRWHDEWIRCSSKGITIDQPALNYVNYTCDGFITDLNPRLNTQVSGVTGAFKYLYDCGILHYFNGEENLMNLTNREVINRVQTDREYIQKIIEEPSLCFRTGIFIAKKSATYSFIDSETFRLGKQIFSKFNELFVFIEFFSRAIMKLVRKISKNDIVIASKKKV